MKVQELIERLQQEDPEAEVHFAYNYGDHCRTNVAPKVRRVDEGIVKFSDYHRMPKLVEDEDEDEEQAHSPTGEAVVVLS